MTTFSLHSYKKQQRAQSRQSSVKNLNTLDTMISIYSLLFVLVLFSELNSHSVTVAMPAAKAEDGVEEQEGLAAILGDESLTEPAVVPSIYRRNLVLDTNTRAEDRSPKIIVISVSAIIFFITYYEGVVRLVFLVGKLLFMYCLSQL